MTYYINPIYFYLTSLSAGMKIFLCVLGGILLVFSAFATVMTWAEAIDITNLDDDEKKALKLFKKIIIVSIILLFIGILVPSKETCIEMLVASQATHENISATKEEIYEIIDYVTDKVNGTESEK